MKRRLQDENLRGSFQEKWNTKLKSLKFHIEEDGWNNLRKIVCEVTDGVLEKNVRNAARNISKNSW